MYSWTVARPKYGDKAAKSTHFSSTFPAFSVFILAGQSWNKNSPSADLWVFSTVLSSTSPPVLGKGCTSPPLSELFLVTFPMEQDFLQAFFRAFYGS